MEFELTIRYPNGPGPFPIIVFSAGGAGGKEGYAPLADYWTSHGYVMLHPGHNTLRPIGASKEGDAERQRNRKGEEIWSSRPRDVSFVIDSLDEIERTQPDLKGKMQRNSIACAGHSAGAYTTMRIGGATAKLDGYPEDLGDARVKALLVLSGQGRDQQGFVRNSWDNVRMPMMVVTGTRDRGATGGRLDWKMEPYIFSPPGDKYLLVLEGGEHNLAGISGRTPENPDLLPAVKMTSLAFFDAYLKNDATASRYVQSENINAYTKERVLLVHK
jgi:dienelactone hydrolase